jgi:predicted dehydrogenase
VSEEKIRIGIVCWDGDDGHVHPVLRHVERAKVTALCDPFPSALEQMRAYFPSASGFLDYDEFLRRARVDALIVATPSDLHRDQVVKAARVGKHVMCESRWRARSPSATT